MNEEEFITWTENCQKEVSAQILLNHLKRKKMIAQKKEKEIQKKIDLLGYKNFLRSPHLEGKENLRKEAAKLCFNSYCSSIGFTKDPSFF